MLNIPYEVKQALRKGCYKKNYKMKVNNVVPIRSVVDIASLTSNDPSILLDKGTYILYNTESTQACDEIVLNGVSSVGYTIPEGATETWFEFEVPETTMTLIAYGFNVDTVYLTIPDNVSYTYNREYSFTIDNDNLVAESVKIDERMVTGKELKFGLCEGSSLEFQYFDHPNINGKDVQVYCSAEYIDGNGDVAWYDIPMGWYTVDQCPRQWSTGIYKVTAYNKLKSNYLDAKANHLIDEMDSDTGQADVITLQTIQDILLQGYQIEYKEEVELHFDPISTGIYETLSNVNCKLIGDNTTYHPNFSSGRSYELTWGAGNNKRVKFVDLDTYIEVLKKSIYSLKNAIYTSFQNPDTLWDNIKSYALSCFGAKIRIELNHDTPNKVAYYTLSELMNNTYLSPTPTSTTIVYGGDIEKLHYFQIPNLSTPSTPNVGILDMRIPETLTLPVSGGLIPVWTNPYSLYDTDVKLYSIEYDDINSMEINTSQMADVTLRNLATANYELHCQYGQLNRITDLFTGVELNQGGLLPADNLYPANDLYPQGDMEHPFPSSYQKLWTDTVGEQSFRYLFITYKTTETVEGQTQEVEKVLQRTVNTNGTTDYNMSDNWLFRNLIWTDEDVGDYADAMVTKMQDIRWFPFEMWAVGMPYIETGDAIEITDKQGNTHTSYVLTRTLNGIQNLQDTFVNGELDIF